jgi:hypothetical protein
VGALPCQNEACDANGVPRFPVMPPWMNAFPSLRSTSTTSFDFSGSSATTGGAGSSGTTGGAGSSGTTGGAGSPGTTGGAGNPGIIGVIGGAGSPGTSTADPRVLTLAALYGWLAEELVRHNAGTSGETWTARRVLAGLLYNSVSAMFGATKDADKATLSGLVQELFQDWCTELLYPGPRCEGEPHGVVIGCAQVAGGTLQGVDPWGGRRWVMHYPLIAHWGEQFGVTPPDVTASRFASLLCCIGNALPTAVMPDTASALPAVDLPIPIGPGWLIIGSDARAFLTQLAADHPEINLPFGLIKPASLGLLEFIGKLLDTLKQPPPATGQQWTMYTLDAPLLSGPKVGPFPIVTLLAPAPDAQPAWSGGGGGGGGGTTYTAGQGIDITGTTIAVKKGNGLLFDTSNALAVQTGAGLGIDAASNSVSVQTGNGLAIDMNNAVVNVATEIHLLGLLYFNSTRTMNGVTTAVTDNSPFRDNEIALLQGGGAVGAGSNPPPITGLSVVINPSGTPPYSAPVSTFQVEYKGNGTGFKQFNSMGDITDPANASPPQQPGMSAPLVSMAIRFVGDNAGAGLNGYHVVYEAHFNGGATVAQGSDGLELSDPTGKASAIDAIIVNIIYTGK